MTTKQPTIKIPKFTEVSKAAQTDIQAVKDSEVLVGSIVVSNNDELVTAAQTLAVVKTTSEEIDERRKGFVKPLQDVVKDLNSFFKPAIESLAVMETALKAKIEGFVTTGLAERDRLLEAVAGESTPTGKAELIASASGITPRDVPGVSIRESWTGEVQDPDALVAWAAANGRFDLLQPNDTVLKAVTKAKKGDPGIPGWYASLKRIVAVTPSKIR